jgi:O-antigen/teichoic acid export membrane protein
MTNRNLRTVFYIGLASFGFIALRFLLVPIRIKLLTSMLDKEQYGTLTLVSLSVSCLAIIFALGSTEFLRSKSPGKPESFQYGALGAAIRLGSAAVAVFAIPLMLLLILRQPSKLDLEAPDFVIACALVLLTLNVVQRVYFLLGQQKFVYARLSQLLYADTWFLPIIPFCFFGTLTVRTVLWVWLGWMILTVALTHRWTGIGKLWQIKTDPVQMREILVFGLPLLPMMLGDWLFRIQDRYILVWLKDATAVANYSLCLNIAMVGYMAGMSLVEIFNSQFFRKVNAAKETDILALANRSEVRDLFQLKLRFGLIVTLPAAAALAQCGESVILVLSNERFLDAVPILAWTAPIPVLFLVYFILGRLLMAIDRNIHLGICTLLAAFLNFILNILLVPSLAERGTAIATVISLLLLNLVLACIVRLPRWLSRSTLQPIRLLALYVLCAGGLHLLQDRLTGHNPAILILGGVWCLAVPFGLGMIRRKDFALMRECVKTDPQEGEAP